MRRCVVLLACAALAAAQSDENVRDTPASRAQAMLAKMNLTEKIDLVHGWNGAYVGNVPANTRLGIPAINMNDGPQGFRGIPGTSTCWPSGLTMAATWNTTAMLAWGRGMGQEFVAKGANVQLGPGVCLARVPVNGRNFEYLSGEDPFLGYTMVQPVIKGIQSQGVIANAKHFMNNNQETNRQYVSANVDERTEFEMYLRPFAGAVEAGVLSIMCSYNRINDLWACENDLHLNTYLKGDLEFGGWVMSDWGATHSTVLSANSGLDQEMPGDDFYGPTLLQAIQNGTVSTATVDDKVLRILTAMYAIGIFDTPNTGNINANVTSVAHNQLSRELAGEAMVLLKNDNGVLPLQATNIAVIGDACQTAPIVHGGGSGQVFPPYVITPLNGIQVRAGTHATVNYFDSSDVDAAVAGAKAAQVAIVCTATTSSEGSDRANLSLPWNEDMLTSAVAAVQPNTVVVVTSPGAVLLPWADDVAGILATFMPGQEAGNAIADVLFGDVNPAGRLPLTFPMIENQNQFTQAEYPGLPANNPSDANYTEALLVGYRWYDAYNSAPRYPFGHGLSYTSFKYSNLQASATAVTAQITNAGSVAGAEVAQLYIAFPSSAGEPPQQLKGFQKVFLNPGQTATVTFNLTQQDLSIWDVGTHSWSLQSGTFGVLVGASSRDVRLKGAFTV